MVIRFKTIAKFVGVAVGAATVMLIADRVIDKTHEEDTTENTAETETVKTEDNRETTKFVVRSVVVVAAMSKIASLAYKTGLEFGVASGAGYVLRNNITMDNLIKTIEDRKAFGSLMNNIWKVVYF
jgi:mannitol-specific phosphotransferase system IIBC component|nr:MAG TPA: hypothetical protein [Caudoviricetes sp.]